MEPDTAYTWNSVPNNPPQKGTDMSAKKLYEITTANGTEYGHKLAVDSTGKWVMEIKGTGAVLAMDKNKVAEVLPYTIGIKFLGNKTMYQYLAEVGTVEVGGLYLYESLYGMAFVHIVEVDTRITTATTHFKPIAKIKMEVV